MLIEKTRELIKQGSKPVDSHKKNNAKFVINLQNAEQSQNLKNVNVKTNFISTVEGLGMQIIAANHEEILKKSKKILSTLKNLELGILSDNITKEMLKDLESYVATFKTEDKKLQLICEEIQLRAKVELAKYN